MERCLTALMGVEIEYRDGICMGSAVSEKLACWKKMRSHGINSDAVLCNLCKETTQSNSQEEAQTRLECFERVLWRGRTDRKFEISEQDASILSQHVRTRADSESVQTCWKKVSFDNYRDPSNAIPNKAAVSACSNPLPSAQSEGLADAHFEVLQGK